MFESLITDDEKNKASYNILIGLGTVIFFIFLLILMIWSYLYDPTHNLFTIVISTIFLIYSVLNIVYVSLNSTFINIDYYNVIFGSSLYMILISLAVLILYCFKFFKIGD